MAIVKTYSFCPKCKKYKEKTHEKMCGDCGTEFINECPACHATFYKEEKHCVMCGHNISQSA